MDVRAVHQYEGAGAYICSISSHEPHESDARLFALMQGSCRSLTSNVLFILFK